MSEPLPPRTDSKSCRIRDYRAVIHTLHQRYHGEWERAERLQGELDRIRGRWTGPFLAWIFALKRWLRRARSAARCELTCVPGDSLCDDVGEVSGRVSIVIPFRDQVELLRGCLRSLRRGSYRDFEIILVDNGSRRRDTARYLHRLAARGAARVVHCPGPFNFSRLCNQGASQAAGDYLLFLNNDTETLTVDWLQRLLRIARRKDTGIVGATLLYPDGTIQHAGLFPRPDGRWIHAYRGCPWDSVEAAHRPHAARVVPAVSAACLMIRRDLFAEFGGFDERLSVTYNDVDLCCRVRDKGLLVVVTPHARLVHFECLSRGFAGDQPGEEHLTALNRFPPIAAG
jgi:O-antigen biosynthesis protein